MQNCIFCGEPSIYQYCDVCMEYAFTYENMIGYILEHNLKKEFYFEYMTEQEGYCSNEELIACEDDWYKLYDRNPQEALDMMKDFIDFDLAHYLDWIERNDYL